MLYGIFRIDFIDLVKIWEFKKSKESRFSKLLTKTQWWPIGIREYQSKDPV